MQNQEEEEEEEKESKKVCFEKVKLADDAQVRR